MDDTSSDLSQSRENNEDIHQSWPGHLWEMGVSEQKNVSVLRQLAVLRKVLQRKIVSSQVVDPIINAKLSQFNG